MSLRRCPTNRFRLALGTLATIGIVTLTSSADAVPGSMCQHGDECSSGEVCVADSPVSSTGHCVRIKVLP
jgi:hypothetical protein